MMKVTAAAATACIVLLLAQPMELQGEISVINCGSQGDSFKASLEQLLSGIPTDQYEIHVTCRDPCTTVIIAFPAGVVTVNFDVCTRKFI